MPVKVQIWKGKLEGTNVPWSSAKEWMMRTDGQVQYTGLLTKSPYSQSFTQGATILPLLVFFVSEKESSALGIAQGRMAVQSHRTVYEKKFVRPAYSGDTLLPFKIVKPMLVSCL